MDTLSSTGQTNPAIFVFDFDGTLCHGDGKYPPVAVLYMALDFLGQEIEIWSASSRYHHEISHWLDEQRLAQPSLIRTRLGDSRPAPDLKLSWADEPRDSPILLIIDNDLKVCRHLHSHSYPVLHVF